MGMARNSIVTFLFIIVLSAGFSLDAYGLTGGHPDEQNFAIKDGHIYVVSSGGLFLKIEEDSGDIEWRTQVTLGRPIFDEKAPYCGGAYTEPVFADNLFFTSELTERRLLGVDCETGHIVVRYAHGRLCDFADFVQGLFFYEGLILIVERGVWAIDMREKTRKWEFSCESNNVVFLYDYFQIEDSMFLLISRPKTEGMSWYAAQREPENQKYEMVELSCSSGEVLNIFGFDASLGDTGSRYAKLMEIGEWRGDRVIVAEVGIGSDDAEYPLFLFDIESKSAKTPMMQLNDWSPGKKVLVDIDFKPIVLGDSLVYYLYDSEDASLISRSLQDGKIKWHLATDEGEILYAAAEQRLFTLIHGEHHFTIAARSAATGKICWKNEIEIEESNRGAPTSAIEMKISEGRVHLLTWNYIHAFDASSGKILWEVPLVSSECKK
jgi:outer membrane protein assembly factor BamB